ncbi:MAG TPA: translesion DNA synthesis-associated protein ImuA [Steroidobacteraceae bacterium]|jgi:cell division inhibitor SulA/protein ImuA|nr:translesion DNA synthesis-associated protein ImuA [Steroidobacteraceae bacterium]
MANSQQLAELLAHPSVWRGRSRAALETFSTGFAALDAGLPGGGWPRHGLVEILTPRPGVGELYLLLPVLAALSRATPARWCTWVSPPHGPFAPALEAHGVALERMLLVRTLSSPSGARNSQRRRGDGDMSLWALEQALRSGACGIALAWPPRASPRAIRRLQLAAEQGRALGVLYRSQRFAHVASPAMLRVMLDPIAEPGRQGARLQLLKSRGGSREPIEITWTAAAA